MDIFIEPYKKEAIHDVKDGGQLLLLFSPEHNGDIYSVPDGNENPKLICSSGRPLTKVLHRGEIHEKIVRTVASFDATLLRLFFYKDRWYLSSRKRIDATVQSWRPFKYTFGELFEKFAKFDRLDSYLQRDLAYTFLLISPDIQNVLPNKQLELIHCYTFNSRTQKHYPYNYRKPSFAGVNYSRLTGWTQEVKAPVTDNDKSSKTIIQSQLKRPQRGLIYIGQSGQSYQMDYHFFTKWQFWVEGRDWQQCFFQLLKFYVCGKKKNLLMDFCRFYEEKGFLQTFVYFKHMSCYFVQCFEQGIIPQTPELIHILYLNILKKHNKLKKMTNEFTLRILAFQPYSLLNQFVDLNFQPILIEPPEVMSAPNQSLALGGPSESELGSPQVVGEEAEEARLEDLAEVVVQSAGIVEND